MDRLDKTANKEFYNTRFTEDRRRFQVEPGKVHSVDVVVSAIVPHLRRGARVLDVAGGSGVHASRIAEEAAVKVVGVDIAEGMVRQRRQDPNLRDNVVGDMEALPFASGSFDAAIYIACLHHVPDPLPALREAVRVLRPGGLLFSFDPSSLRAWRKGTLPVEGFEHEFRIWGPRLAEQMQSAGLTIESIAGFELTMRVLGRVIRKPPLRLLYAADAVDRVLGLVPRLELLGGRIMIRARKGAVSPLAPAEAPLPSIVACPRCKGPLEAEAHGDGLACLACAVLYPVHDDVAILLADEAEAPSPR